MGKLNSRGTGLPDLSRTRAAIEAYDAFNESHEFNGSQSEVLAEFAELEKLAENVGLAFGLDTSDRNDVETCKAIIRPGHKVPGPGCELSFVRRMVKQWEESSNV